eukprot:71904-Rhodomonas_salina.6
MREREEEEREEWGRGHMRGGGIVEAEGGGGEGREGRGEVEREDSREVLEKMVARYNRSHVPLVCSARNQTPGSHCTDIVLLGLDLAAYRATHTLPASHAHAFHGRYPVY